MELRGMTWPAAREALHERAVALLPVGSTEQHGPHLPLETDALTAELVARRACEEGAGVLLPTIPVGLSAGHRQFWGTLWVSPAAFHAYVSDIVANLRAHSVWRVVLVNGHGGNSAALHQVARERRQEGTATYVFEWWRSAAAEVATVVDTSGGHADERETSVLLAARPERVDTARFEEAYAGAAQEWGKQLYGVHIGFDTVDFSASGCVGDPRTASTDKGEHILNAAAEKLRSFCGWLAEQNRETLLSKEHLP